jgi:hypothetical protein
MPNPRKDKPLTERIDELKTSAPAPEDFDDEPGEGGGGVDLGGATAGTPTGPATMTAADAGTPAHGARDQETEESTPQ